MAKTSRRAPLRKTSRHPIVRRNAAPVKISPPADLRDAAALAHYLRVAYPIGEWVRFTKPLMLGFDDVDVTVPLDARAEIIGHIPGDQYAREYGGPQAAVTLRFPDVTSYVFDEWAALLKLRETDLIGPAELAYIEVLGATAPNPRLPRLRGNCARCATGRCPDHGIARNTVPPPPYYRTSGPRGSTFGGPAFEHWVQKTFAKGTRVRLTAPITMAGKVIPADLRGTVFALVPAPLPVVRVSFERPPNFDALPRAQREQLEALSTMMIGLTYEEVSRGLLEPLDDNWGALVSRPLGRHMLPSSQRSWLAPPRSRPNFPEVHLGAPRPNAARSRPAEYGPEYLFRVHYREQRDPDFGGHGEQGSRKVWAYSAEHARERFNASPDAEDFEITKVERLEG